jgi:gliding-associated putative ABC transporter substrate-binding component GldG
MKNRKQLISGFALIIGVLILVNILSDNYHLRLDFTADKSFTLSKATKNILKELKEPVTITAYFSEDVHPQIDQIRRDFKDMLIEYSNLSKHKLVYEFINPSEKEDLEQKAQQAGIQPRLVELHEKNQIKQQKAYFGAVVQMGERSEIIPIVQSGASMEYSLSAAIKKLSVANKPKIGLLQGHGEPGLNQIHQAYAELNILYDVEPVYLTDTAYTLNKYKTLAIIAPKDTLPAKHLAQLEKYLEEGGNVYIALNHVEGNFQNASGFVQNTGIENWLKTKGLTVEDNFVVDSNCGSVMVQQQQQGYTMQSQLQFPYLPVISKFADHPATKGLEAVIFQFASTVSFSNKSGYSFVPLAFTSDKSGTQPTPVYFDINRKWGASDFPLKNLPVAGALSPNQGSKEGKIVIITDGNFAINGEGQQQQQLQPDNINLMVNCIDWLSDDTGLIDLRTKGITARLLDQIDDGTKTFLQYFNFFLPILLIIGYGIYRVNHNRNIRMKRMEARYV